MVWEIVSRYWRVVGERVYRDGRVVGERVYNRDGRVVGKRVSKGGGGGGWMWLWVKQSRINGLKTRKEEGVRFVLYGSVVLHLFLSSTTVNDCCCFYATRFGIVNVY